MAITKLSWLDPGGTTGYTLAMYDSEKRVLSFAYGQEKWNELELFEFIEKTMPHILGFESFEYRSHLDKADLTPCYLIGVIHMIHQMKDAFPIEIHYQQPSMKDQFWTARRLKDRGYYARGLEHGRDSIRHLLQWFFFGAGAKLWMNREHRVEEPTCEFIPMALMEMRWKT